MVRDDIPEIDERLAHSGNGADLLIAAALAPKAVGRRLIMLYGEWDSCAKPRRPLQHDIDAIFRSLPRIKPRFCISPEAMEAHWGREPKLRADQANKQAAQWYENERLRVMGCLKSLGPAREGLTNAAERLGVENAGRKVLAVIAWWLDHTCPVCNGTKYEVVPGTNRQSSRTCRPAPHGCGGTGERHLPHGREGRAIETLMINYVHRARQQIGSLHRGFTGVRWKSSGEG